jgi:hypothetical protein
MKARIVNLTPPQVVRVDVEEPYIPKNYEEYYNAPDGTPQMDFDDESYWEAMDQYKQACQPIDVENWDWFGMNTGEMVAAVILKEEDNTAIELKLDQLCEIEPTGKQKCVITKLL